MEIVQITAIGIVSAILAITLKKHSPEFSLLISIGASVLIFFIALPWLTSVFDVVNRLAEQVQSSKPYVLIVLKIVGIAYIAEFGSQICIDAGESGIASKIELAGKTLILMVAAPIVLSIIDIINNALS